MDAAPPQCSWSHPCAAYLLAPLEFRVGIVVGEKGSLFVGLSNYSKEEESTHGRVGIGEGSSPGPWTNLADRGVLTCALHSTGRLQRLLAPGVRKIVRRSACTSAEQAAEVARFE